jgi:type I restriction-modification system DNA methylase subunit
MGFGNLLEGDFFAWYCTEGQWNKDISLSVRSVFSVLTQYESQPLFKGSDGVKDFFKDLYMNIIPDKVRHSLGEFYTPPWLADHVVSQALKVADKSNKSWSGVDPCCGSGTFLTVLLHKKMETLSGKTDAQILKAVLRDVKGIDLNPLAVLTSRINYFINISHLVDENDSFEIPVYLGDASYVPESIEIGNVKCINYQIQTLEGVIDITLPKSAIFDVNQFSNCMTFIETDIKNQDADSIFNSLLELCSTQDRTALIKKYLKELSGKLVELESKDWNGIWARIITNFLTTANLGTFDIIVGNPPWIDWKNLPAGYRERE